MDKPMITLEKYKELLSALGGKTVFEGALKNMPQPNAPLEFLYAHFYISVMRRRAEWLVTEWLPAARNIHLTLPSPDEATNLKEYIAWDKTKEWPEAFDDAEMEASDWLISYLYENGRKAEIRGKDWESADERSVELLKILWTEDYLQAMSAQKA